MEGSIFVIFGANGGIGSTLARLLHSQGRTVYLLGRNEKALSDLSLELSQPYLIVDALDEKAVESTLVTIKNKHGSIDGVASCIGSVCLKPLHSVSLEEFDQVFRVNTLTAFSIIKASCSVMADQKKGSVVLCSSTASLIGLANHEAIAAAKGAINAMVRSAAASYAHKGIRVNAVAPGLVKTPLTQNIVANEMALKASTAFHPLGRIGDPLDVAQAISWLFDPQNSWITGHVLPIDGGLSSIKTKI
ncbi:MAG: SDR family oxidoreductase [Chlamydiae bacterium]|nr:SDR family oxidoreductase [Chlamydiota bacterium]